MLMLLGGDHTSGTPISQEGMDDQALLQRVIRTVYGPQPFNIPREIRHCGPYYSNPETDLSQTY